MIQLVLFLVIGFVFLLPTFFLIAACARSSQISQAIEITQK